MRELLKPAVFNGAAEPNCTSAQRRKRNFERIVSCRELTAHQWTKEQLRRQVKNAIYRVFDAAKNRDFGILASMHYPSEEMFSKFDYSSPYRRQTFSQALMHEEVAYSNITDFNYKVEELKIDLLSDEVALATFHLETGGLFVNDYRFEGSPARSRVRVTMVFLWKEDQWLIVHEHFSRFPEESTAKETK